MIARPCGCDVAAAPTLVGFTILETQQTVIDHYVCDCCGRAWSVRQPEGRAPAAGSADAPIGEAGDSAAVT
ncbi:MAG TPA: hypothetical protein VEC57_15020 [Candidatus Limnocylindrales bacterium]|nr:hypothetical protein [Candidatus Limnocylindrales bacterium]